jgi:hypothetical protein
MRYLWCMLCWVAIAINCTRVFDASWNLIWLPVCLFAVGAAFWSYVKYEMQPDEEKFIHGPLKSR